MKNDAIEFLGDPDEQKCIAAVLSLYAWEPYNYKAHAWVRKPRRRASWRTGQRYKWAISTDTPIQLISRTTGESVSELVRYQPTRRFGAALFAGDPRGIGVFRDMRLPTGGSAVWFTHSTSVDRGNALAIGLSLASCAPLPSDFPEPRFSELIWLADEKPEMTANSVTLATDNRKLRKILP
ncbi:hypothetical protein [Nocardia sp. NPDC019395]|uniref:hypothetical protein n=1 Tax=Nocardia sp. NPDC019395 TaxID=3154686 RepID=UPI0033CC5133